MTNTSSMFTRHLIGIVLTGASLFVLTSPCRADVHGIVTNAVTHQPVGGVGISVLDVGTSPVIPLGSAVSAADGSYTVSLPAGNGGRLFTSRLGFADYWTDLPTQPRSLRLDIALTPVAAVQGMVFGPDGSPVSASVDVLDAATHDDALMVSSDDNGQFAFNNIQPARYIFCVVNPYDAYRDSCYDHHDLGADGVPNGTPVDIASGQFAGNLDIHLQTGASISGTLTDRATHAPIHSANLEFTLYTPQGTPVTGFTNYNAEDGSYHIDGLAPGSYYLAIGAQFTFEAGYYPQLYGGTDCDPVGPSYFPICSFAGVTPLAVPQAGLTHIDFALSSGGTISGRVTDAATGEGIPGIQVYTCIPPSYRENASVYTDNNGNYVFSHVLDRFMLRTGGASPYMNLTWPHTLTDAGDQCAAGDPASPLTLATETSTLAGIDFSLSEGSHVSGRVAGNQGVPVRIALFQFVGTNDWQYTQTITTAADGSFEVDDLASAHYTAVAYLDDGTGCIVYGNFACGAGWHASDPASADLTTESTIWVDAGIVVLDFNFALPNDHIFHNGFE